MHRSIEIIIFVIICSLVHLSYAYEKESKCLAEKSNLLTIACPANKITRIIKAFYGYSWSGDCHFIEKDCVVDVPNDDLSCVGEGCSVRIIDSPIILQECWSLMASYIQVDYECIAVEQLQNMCTVQESEFPVGYIVTPDYPSALKSELSCPCTLQAPSGYTITLEVLDFRMASCSQTGLTVWSDSSTYTHCSSISTGVLPGSGGQNISMRLHSQAERSNAGFLLKYFASPQDDSVNIKFVCYGSSQLWQTNTAADPRTYGSSVVTVIPKKADAVTTKYTQTTATTTATTVTKAGGSFSTNSYPTSDEPVLVETTTTTTFNNFTSINDSVLTKETITSTENTKSFKMVDFKEEKFNDWTVIIISVVASVIFLLIMINALIWFIFSIKSDKKTMNKKLTNTIYSEHYYPQTQEYYKSALSNDDVYMASTGGPAPGGGNPNNKVKLNPGGNVGSKDALWKSAESLNAFTTHYLNNQAQIPTTTWPRMNAELPNLMSTSMPYGFNFEKAGGKKPKKYKLSKEEKKRIKEWEFLQELRLKKIKDDEMQHFLASTADTTSSKFIIPNEYNHLKAAKGAASHSQPQTNWPKYAKYNQNSNKDDENPAIIIDDDERHANVKQHAKKQAKRVEHHSQDYFDNTSRGGEESMVAFSDAVMLKSASQVPVNMQNPAYMYEEQEGSIDLRSEYSFYSKNAPAPLPKRHHGDNMMTNNIGNLNKKSHEDNKAFCEYKDISSWKDVY